jgi:hypothetical protein
MSTADIVETDDFAKVAVPLLKEYAGKMKQTRERLRATLGEALKTNKLTTSRIWLDVRRDLVKAEIAGARKFIPAAEAGRKNNFDNFQRRGLIE